MLVKRPRIFNGATGTVLGPIAPSILWHGGFTDVECWEIREEVGNVTRPNVVEGAGDVTKVLTEACGDATKRLTEAGGDATKNLTEAAGDATRNLTEDAGNGPGLVECGE